MKILDKKYSGVLFIAISLVVMCYGLVTISSATEKGFNAAIDSLSNRQAEDVINGEEDYSSQSFEISEMNTLRICYVNQNILKGSMLTLIGGGGVLLSSYFLLKFLTLNRE